MKLVFSIERNIILFDLMENTDLSVIWIAETNKRN